MTFINRIRLSAFTIGQRLLAQTVVMALVLALIATLAFFALGYARQSSLDLHHKVDQTTQINHLVSGLQQDFVENLNNLNAGAVTWPAAYERALKAREAFVQQWQALGEHHSESLVGHEDGAVQQSLLAGKEQVLQAFGMFEALSDNQSRAALELFMLNDLGSMIEPFLLAASTYGDRLNQQAEQAFVQSETVLSNSLYIGSALIIAGLVISILLGVMIRRSIVDPVSIIQNTVTQVESGDSHARTGMHGHDELSTLGQALDHLLDEKVATLLRIEKENEDLNESVIQLLEGTSRLSERDLTSRLKIREDVTGPVADALNLMTREMAEALVSIHKVGEYVNTSSLTVDEQAGKVLNIARAEQELVVQAKLKLETLADDMARIADWCQQCDATAHAASATTDKAFAAVSETVDSMGSIREGISETEKRIKRLSERSQEISGIVDIISSIAERTHVLALNASMQAAAAGEAGRGFAVVADEVQRLAENARNATSQISGLVRNIQSETADAVDTMNRSISQVVDGSGKASQAGQQMQETQQTTRSLVQSVEQIATTSREQAQAAEVLKGHSEQIAESSRFTGEELARQSQHTQRLKSAAKILQQTVELFQLPDMADVNIVLPQEVNLPEAKTTPTEPTLNKLAG